MPTLRNAHKQTVPRILVAIAFHRSSQPLLRAVRSAMSLPGVKTHVLVLDSTPTSTARHKLRNLPVKSTIMHRRSQCRTAYAARNALIRMANSMAGSFDWIMRLDADDTFVTEKSILGSLCEYHVRKTAVLFGNNQVDGTGRIIGTNMPSTNLLNRTYLLRRLRRMALGDFNAELPSCNLLLRLPTKWRYPALRSAEDHALLAKICVTKPDELGICRRVTLVNYTLNGQTTKDNLRNQRYISSRNRIVSMAANWMRNES